jgi:hypothetical protein
MSLWRKLIHIKIHIALIVAGIVWTTAYATVSIAEEHSADIVNMRWTLLQIGLGGYVAGRSLEKITPKIADAIRK